MKTEKGQVLDELLHWIWSWHLQLKRLADSTRLDGSGATDIDRRRSFSATSLDQHVLLVVGRNLIRAYEAAQPNLISFGHTQQNTEKLVLLRNLYEHWNEQQPTFRPGGPEKKLSGKVFSNKYPTNNPWSITYASNDWLIGGVLPLNEVTLEFTALEQFVVNRPI